MNPFSSNLPPVFSHEGIYSDDQYNLDYPFMSQLNFPVINPQSAPQSFNNDPMIIMNDHHHHLEQKIQNGCFDRGKKPIRRDKHSKIYTVNGLRDRRVRLSIGVAREFFDLHDMLGFDKASKTLEWLLKKSGKAIQELAKSKKNFDRKDEDNVANDQDKRFGLDSNSENLEEESTRKTENKKLKNPIPLPENITQSQILNRETASNVRGFEDDEKLSTEPEDQNIFVEQDVVGQSIFIKRKPSHGFSFNNSNRNEDIVNLSRDWNSNRHHDLFDDSSVYPSIANTHTSHDDIGNTGFHMYGKPW